LDVSVVASDVALLALDPGLLGDPDFLNKSWKDTVALVTTIKNSNDYIENGEIRKRVKKFASEKAYVARREESVSEYVDLCGCPFGPPYNCWHKFGGPTYIYHFARPMAVDKPFPTTQRMEFHFNIGQWEDREGAVFVDKYGSVLTSYCFEAGKDFIEINNGLGAQLRWRRPVSWTRPAGYDDNLPEFLGAVAQYTDEWGFPYLIDERGQMRYGPAVIAVINDVSIPPEQEQMDNNMDNNQGASEPAPVTMGRLC
jgi:hypothetical protein